MPQETPKHPVKGIFRTHAKIFFTDLSRNFIGFLLTFYKTKTAKYVPPLDYQNRAMLPSACKTSGTSIQIQ